MWVIYKDSPRSNTWYQSMFTWLKSWMIKYDWMENVKSRVVLLIWWLVQSEIWRTTLICNLNWFCSEITSGLVMFWKCVVFALCLFLYSILSVEWKTMSRMQLAKRKQHSIDVHVVCSYSVMPFFLSKSCARNIVLFYMILLSHIMYRT
jgi:hypothetical protein